MTFQDETFLSLKMVRIIKKTNYGVRRSRFLFAHRDWLHNRDTYLHRYGGRSAGGFDLKARGKNALKTRAFRASLLMGTFVDDNGSRSLNDVPEKHFVWMFTVLQFGWFYTLITLGEHVKKCFFCRHYQKERNVSVKI